MTVELRPRARTACAALLCTLLALAVARPTLAAWTTNGPAGEDVLSLAIDPITPTTIYAGAELGRIFKSIDGGKHWDLLDTGLLTGALALIITPDAGTIYVGTDNGLFASTDAGKTWNPAGLDATVVNALVIDPNAPQTIYAGAGGGGGDQGVFRGTVGSTQWMPTSNGLPDAIVHALSTDPLEAEHTFPTTLFAATEGGLYRSVDQAASWQPINMGLPDPMDALVNVVAPHPTNLFTLYAGTDVGMFVSNDIGQTWQPAGASFTSSVSSIAIDMASDNIYAGTFGDGVFTSPDGGATWNPFSNGLANGVVHALALQAGPPPTLFAATIGDGVFSTALGPTQCLGDCDGSGDVTVDEIVLMVNIDLGSAEISVCPAADPDSTGTVAVTQIVAAVNNALNGCSAAG